MVDNRPLAESIGARIKAARVRAGLTQKQLAEGRYTAAYISALELGHAKPSMAALAFIAERLGIPAREFVGADESEPSRIAADLALAAGDAQSALDAYTTLLDGATDRRRRAELLRASAEALCRLDRGGDAIGPATEAAELFRAQHRPADAADAEYWLAYAQFQVDNIGEAKAILGRLLEQARLGIAPVPDFRFRVLMATASAEQRDGEYQRAIAYMEEARGLGEDLDLRRRASLLAGLALSYREAGDLEASVMAGVQSLALYRAAEAEREGATLSNNLALTYLAVGNLAKADELLTDAAATATRLEDRRLLAHVTESQAQLALARGRTDEAAVLLSQAMAIATETDNQQALASAHETASKIALVRGDPDAAIASLRAAVELLRVHGPKARLRDALGQLAELHRGRGELAAATDLYAEALAIRR